MDIPPLGFVAFLANREGGVVLIAKAPMERILIGWPYRKKCREMTGTGLIHGHLLYPEFALSSLTEKNE